MEVLGHPARDQAVLVIVDLAIVGLHPHITLTALHTHQAILHTVHMTDHLHTGILVHIATALIVGLQELLLHQERPRIVQRTFLAVSQVF